MRKDADDERSAFPHSDEADMRHGSVQQTAGWEKWFALLLRSSAGGYGILCDFSPRDDARFRFIRHE
jgi:hypothetical protein